MIAPELLGVVHDVAEVFHAAGHRLFLVGGIVRDQLLDPRGHWSDLDLTTDARPAAIKHLVAPLATAVWTQGERFGTIGCRIDGHPYEITTFRGEAYDSASRKPSVVFADALEDDLSRRDFTINAIAADARTGEVHDPFGGRRDLDDRLLRTPSGADTSFSDDPLRMLRAARFLARFSLRAAADLDDAIERQRHRLAIVSVERVRDELHKLLLVEDPTRGVRFLLDHGLLARWLPELDALARLHDPAHGGTDALTHTLEVVRRSPVDVVVRLAALVHDLAKVDGIAGHAARGAVLAQERLDALRHSRHDTRVVHELVALHHRLHDPDRPWDARAVRMLVADAGEHVDELVALSRANASARAGAAAAAHLAHVDAFADLHARLRDDVADLAPELDGAAVMRVLGIGPGRDVGDALAHLRERRLAHGRVGEDAAADELRAWWAARPR